MDPWSDDDRATLSGMAGPSSAMTKATSKCDGNKSSRRQPLHLGNDRFELCIVLHRFHRRDPRCIWATSFEKVMTRSFLVLHEAIASRQLSCAGSCLTGEPNGGRRASGETAAVCADAVVRNRHPRRLVRGEARRLRVAREYRNADLEPRGDTRRNDFER